MKAKKPVPRAKTPEAIIQQSIEDYLDKEGLVYFHVPDALLKAGFAHGSAINYALINAAAAVRGFPDLVIFDPAQWGFVLPIEAKTIVGRMTDAPRKWQKWVGTRLCRSKEEAVAEVERWRKDPIGYWHP